MTLLEFVAENRCEIDSHVTRAYKVYCADDDEREDFVLNDESLYNWACAEIGEENV